MINNKKYIGKRTYRGNNILDDKYLGSGTVFKKALNKYGSNSFKKIIIAICDTEEDAYGYERTLIDSVGAVSSKEYYNLIEGHRDIPRVKADNVQIVMLDTSTGKYINRCNRHKKIIRITNKINKILGIGAV